jgi:tetratricopeptide (TPR) repeat protein
VGRPADQLQPGEAFGNRYHIIRLLGVGGMGAVYQGWDDELGVAVAIKTIRPDPTADAAAAQDLERRFKRELVLARQVTHPNVVRIHDLGEVNGLKYITMPFINGQTLAAELAAEGRLPVPRALAIFRQLVAGMEAAHAKGIVHRDLKPANIMLEDGQVFIMDFGIARSVASSTQLTQAGSVVGTFDYMAPEQATGKPIDQRADIYALGLILQDMLAGRGSRLKTDNPLSDLMQRIQTPPTPVRAFAPQVPEAIESMISRCLQVDPGARFATTGELAAALASLNEEGHVRPVSGVQPLAPATPKRAWVVGAGVAALVLVAAASAWFLTRPSSSGPVTPVAHATVSVLIANFDNRTGDTVFQGTLEQALVLGLEGASFITAYPRDQATRIAAEIAPGQTLDEERARLVAVREGVQIVLAGLIEPDGGGYRISARAMDGASGAPRGDATATAPGRAEVLQAAADVATSLRRTLGDATADAPEPGLAETFTASSIDAVSAYARAQDLSSAGRFPEAIAAYQEALQHDPGFGRAYSGWAVAALRMGRPEEAEGLWKKALGLLERMTERERYRTLGGYYLGPGANDEQAIENYRMLVERFPADGVGHNNLGVAYFNTLDFRRAMEQGRRAIDVFPSNTTYRTNLALYAMYAGEFDTAVVEARRALEQRPFDKAYLPIAVAAIAGGRPDEAAQAYREMARVGSRGASIAAMGLADLAAYRGLDEEARAELERGAAADEIGNQRAPRAMKLVALAALDLAAGERARALSRVDEALALSRPEGVVVPAARLLVAAGRPERAETLAAELESQIQKRRRALGGLVRAEIALSAGRTVQAIDHLTAARALADLWVIRETLGRVYVEAGRHAEALTELEAAAGRPGEGAAIYLDDWPTMRETVTLKYWLARAQHGLGLADSATKNYEAYLALRGKAPSDRLAADARKRLATP